MSNNNNKNILVVIAHPDDETFGMGGTINKHINDGDKVFVISMTNGVGSRKNLTEKKIKEREIAGNNASKILGFSWHERFDFPDNAMDKYPLIEYVKCIESSKEVINPSIVYTHSAADLNIDHRRIAEAVITAFRPEPEEKCKEIRLFETLSATDYSDPYLIGNFVPNLFINIKNNWTNKLNALESYEAELRNYPHTRSIKSIKNLAIRRGNQVGIEMAEAFQIIRSIIN